MAARQISTTSSFRRFASRPSRTNLSMAQKQIAPTTQIIRIPIRSEIIAIPILRPGPRRLCQANVTIWNCKIMSFGAERSPALTVHPMSRLSRHPSPRRPQFTPRTEVVTLRCLSHRRFGSSICSVRCGCPFVSSKDKRPSIVLMTSTSSCRASAASGGNSA